MTIVLNVFFRCTGWLADWLTVWLINRSVGLSVGWSIDQLDLGHIVLTKQSQEGTNWKLTLFGQAVFALTITSIHFDQPQIHAQAGSCLSFIYHRMQEDKSSSQYWFVLYSRKGWTEMSFSKLLLTAPTVLVHLSGHPSQVHVPKLVFPNEWWLATPFGAVLTFALHTGVCRSDSSWCSRHHQTQSRQKKNCCFSGAFCFSQPLWGPSIYHAQAENSDGKHPSTHYSRLVSYQNARKIASWASYIYSGAPVQVGK